MTFQCMQTYIVDTYTKFAASAMAAVSVLRSLAAFGFPLFAPYITMPCLMDGATVYWRLSHAQ